ncbi:hypothetical protein HYG77_33745 (plasmid) [Rhodococcus sp. ZPP]|uniref:hypothetical protein n=1 Tax=Rhodococcus sp. ZPP TaxID=2749906 RepID=UPI001AD897EE|nr:hypothetical protein [Rhodococcus sp. ZPP]QTJ70485.1 hypothetical protein HYG77_33745 [Rhodococcus sp. ZPP]
MGANDHSPDAGGPTVGLCAGMRCAALWCRHETDTPGDVFDADGPSRIREVVRTTRGAVLVRLPCVGSCSAGPVVAVGYRAADCAGPVAAFWVGCADTPQTYSALVEWVAAGDWSHGPAQAPPSLRRSS